MSHSRIASLFESAGRRLSSRPAWLILTGVALLSGWLRIAGPAQPQSQSNILAQAPTPSAQDFRKPQDFSIIFTLGYAGDQLPQDPDEYAMVMEKLAAGHFNTVLASHETWRLPIMEQHGLKLMVDMLDERHHIYRNLEGAEALATSLREDPRVWGYHLFSDTASNIVPGRDRDNENMHRWDPSHPTFIGTQQHVKSTLRQLTDPDVIAYYDYHWSRDRGTHFPNLQFFSSYADEKDAALYRWVQDDPGRPGIGNPNRIRYTVMSSLAYGLKGVSWFIGTEMINTRNWEWSQVGLDVIGVNEDLAKLGQEIMPWRHLSTHSSPTFTNANDDPRGDDAPIPPGLTEIPRDSWVRIGQGEVILGLFETEEGRRAAVLANHNAYQAQTLLVGFPPEVKAVEYLDHQTDSWRRLWLIEAFEEDEIAPGHALLLREVIDAPTLTPPSRFTATPAPTDTKLYVPMAEQAR